MESKVEVELPEDKVTMELPLKVRYYVVLYKSMSVTTSKRHQQIK